MGGRFEMPIEFINDHGEPQTDENLLLQLVYGLCNIEEREENIPTFYSDVGHMAKQEDGTDFPKDQPEYRGQDQCQMTSDAKRAKNGSLQTQHNSTMRYVIVAYVMRCFAKNV